ncbi:hypothetical protein TNCV_853861 [Trichonephila clavipes]|nr:hypothetical protein TNCV_853861 [Trichonephila clavipes]
MLAQRLARNTPPATTPEQLWQYVEAAWSAVAQGHIQSLRFYTEACGSAYSRPWRLTNYGFCHQPRVARVEF